MHHTFNFTKVLKMFLDISPNQIKAKILPSKFYPQTVLHSLSFIHRLFYIAYLAHATEKDDKRKKEITTTVSCQPQNVGKTTRSQWDQEDESRRIGPVSTTLTQTSLYINCTCSIAHQTSGHETSTQK
jgi:hypothetical protein